MLRSKIAFVAAVNLLAACLSAVSTPSSASAAPSERFASTGAPSLSIGVDSNGNVFTANEGSMLLTKVTPSGTAADFGPTSAFPRAILVDRQDNILTANSIFGNVTKITPSGTPTTWDRIAYSLYPSALVEDSHGNVYVTQALNNAVYKYTPNGSVSRLASTGSFPMGMTIDSSDNLYVTSYDQNKVTKITPDGTATDFATTGSHPWGITVDTSGNLYVANSFSRYVTRITPDGVSTQLGTTGRESESLTIDSAGNVYVANAVDNTVTKITPDGTSFTFATTGIFPKSIAIDEKNGYLYTANYNDNSVTRISLGENQTINFPELTSINSGDPVPVPAATATSGLQVKYRSTSPEICSISGTTIHTSKPGLCSIQANQPGDEDYRAAAPVSRTFYITPKQTDSISKTTSECLNQTTKITVTGSFERFVSNVALGAASVSPADYSATNSAVVVKLGSALITATPIYIYNGAGPVLTATVQPCASAAEVGSGHGSTTLNVLFKAGSAKLSGAITARIAKFVSAKALTAKKDVAITVIGFGRTSLSLARAKAVASKLAALGLTSKAKLTTRSASSSKATSIRKVLISVRW